MIALTKAAALYGSGFLYGTAEHYIAEAQNRIFTAVSTKSGRLPREVATHENARYIQWI